MKNIKNTTELYLKIYFQIRFYLFLASIHYLVFNYSFTFDINAGNLVFLFMYIFAVILLIFSGIYCFLLSRIITKDLSKKAVFYINSTLMTLSLCLFIYGGLITKNNSIELIILVLLPFLSFNIVSWLITKRAIDKNIITSKKFLRNTFIGWIIFSVIFFLIGSFQPYNRVVVDDDYLNNYNTEISQGWVELDAFNREYKQNELLFLFYDCRTGNFESDCLKNPYFGEDFSKEYESFKQLKNDNFALYKVIDRPEIYKKIVYDNLDKQVYSQLLNIEEKVQNITKKSFYYRGNDFYNSELLYGNDIVSKLYRLLIEYNMYNGEYYRANELINNYYNFVKSYNLGASFEIGYSLIQSYFTQLEENGYTDIVFPDKIQYHKYNYIHTFTDKIISKNIDLINYLPEILFVFNKQQHINYYYYHLKGIENSHFIHTYKNPLFYYVGNNLVLKISQDFKYYHSDFKDNLEFFDYIEKKSEY